MFTSSDPGRDSITGNKQCRKRENFLLQVIQEPARRGVMLDLVLSKKEKLVGKVKPRDSLGCSDHGMVEFENLSAARRVQSRLPALDFRRTGFGHFRDLLGKVSWDKALEGRGV